MNTISSLSNPTEQTYAALQTAYDYFNALLFENKLPPCLITLQRKDKRIHGYFWRARFSELGGTGYTDEIAMNPQSFTIRSIEEVLATLAHEMCHLWQHHFGKPSRVTYHNKQWAEQMKSIGLQPSHTGQPGGKEVGQHMTHYIIENGPFSTICAGLLAEDFKLAWGEIIDQMKTDNGTGPNRSNRIKYTCPDCGTNAWGKPELSLICGNCETAFLPAI